MERIEAVDWDRHGMGLRSRITTKKDDAEEEEELEEDAAAILWMENGEEE